MDINNRRCLKCDSLLHQSIIGQQDLCDSCGFDAAPSKALRDTLVYFEDTNSVRRVLKHTIVLCAIGVVALIAYYLGS